MADLRQKQIVDKILANLKDNVGTEYATVSFFYGFAISEDLYRDQVAVELLPGEEENLQDDEEQSISKVSLLFDVSIILHFAGTRATLFNESNVYTELAEAFKKVYSVMMADHTQGLSFVTNTRYKGASGAEIEGGEQIYGKMVLNFSLIYKHSYTDASA